MIIKRKLFANLKTISVAKDEFIQAAKEAGRLKSVGKLKPMGNSAAEAVDALKNNKVSSFGVAASGVTHSMGKTNHLRIVGNGDPNVGLQRLSRIQKKTPGKFGVPYKSGL